MIKRTIAVVAVAVLAITIGVGLSAQMAPTFAQGRPGADAPWMDDPDQMGGPGGMGGPDQMGRPHGMGRPGRGHGGGPGMFGPMGPGLRGLDLTVEQRKKVREAVASHQDAFKAIGDRMMTARQALMAAVTADALDEAKVRAAAAEVAKVEADAAVLRAKVHAQVFGLLTPEQQKKAREFRTEREERMKERRELMQKRMERRSKREQGRPEVV